MGMCVKTVFLVVGVAACSSSPTSDPVSGVAPSPEVVDPEGAAPYRNPDAPGLQARPNLPPVEYTPVGETSTTPRSILLISWDTVRADRMGLYGGRALTPQLDALAAEGVRFDAALTPIPETSLAHWAVMTGVSPMVHGDVPGTGASRYRGPTLAEIARTQDYATGAFIGGITLSAHASGLDRGFDRFDDHHDWDATALKRPGMEVSESAISWMEGQDTPFLAFVHFFDAHTPYNPPSPWNGRYADGEAPAPLANPGPEDREDQLGLYDGAISFLDSLLPALIEAAGEDCVVVLFSDHGESFEHGYLYNHRDSLWDSTLRVPLVIRAPGLSASVVSEQVGLVDLFPTVLELAGLPGEAKSQGESLLLLARGGQGGRPIAQAVARPFQEEAAFAARTLSFKAIWGPGNSALAYDLSTDPAEQEEIGSIPEILVGEPEAHESLLEAAAVLQHPVFPPRALPPEEVERLEALGYAGETTRP